MKSTKKFIIIVYYRYFGRRFLLWPCLHTWEFDIKPLSRRRVARDMLMSFFLLPYRCLHVPACTPFCFILIHGRMCVRLPACKRVSIPFHQIRILMLIHIMCIWNVNSKLWFTHHHNHIVSLFVCRARCIIVNVPPIDTLVVLSHGIVKYY